MFSAWPRQDSDSLGRSRAYLDHDASVALWTPPNSQAVLIPGPSLIQGDPTRVQTLRLLPLLYPLCTSLLIKDEQRGVFILNPRAIFESRNPTHLFKH